MANATSTQLQELYVAYFGRAADPTGLDYWTERGITTAAFAANMYAQPEFKSAYGTLSIESQVNQIYKNLFDREADVAGLTYWSQQIRLGNLQLAEIANDLVWAAQNNSGSADDKAALTNRTEAAVAYTAKIKETTAGILAYQPLNDGLTAGSTFSAGDNITAAKAYLSTIDKDTASTAAGIAASVLTITTNGVPATSTAAKTLTLTTTQDTLTGGDGNDKISGVVVAAGTTGTTFQAGDVITGGAGTDILTISLSGAASSYTLNGVVTTGVEKVLLSNYDTDASVTTVDATLLGGLTTVGLTSSGANGDTTFTSMTSLTNAEMKNGTADLTLTHEATTVVGTSDAISLELSNVSAGTFTAASIETLTVNSSLAATTLTDLVIDNASTLNITGSANLTLSDEHNDTNFAANSSTAAAAIDGTVDASAFTGALDIKFNSGDVISVTGGSGADTIDFAAGFDKYDVVNGGAGVDTLSIDVANATLTKTELAGVSNIETLEINSTNDSAVLNADGIDSSITTLKANANSVIVDVDATISDGDDLSFAFNSTTYTIATAAGTGTIAEVASELAVAINAIDGYNATVVDVDGTGDGVEVEATTGDIVPTIASLINTTDTAAVTTVFGDMSNISFTNIVDQTVEISAAKNVTASLKDASGTADSLTINLTSKSADKASSQTIAQISAANIETLNINTSGLSANTVDYIVTTLTDGGDTDLNTLNITGDSSLDLSGTITAVDLTTVNASTFTGDLRLDGVAEKQTITTGSGADEIIMGSNLDNDDTIDGGTGTDTLTAVSTSLTATTGALSITNVETLNLTNTGASVIDASKITNATEIAVLTNTTSTTITNLAAGVSVGAGHNNTDGATAGLFDISLADATGTADSLTFNLNDTAGGNTNAIELKATGIETVTVNVSDTTDASNANATLDVDSLNASSIVVTGSDGDVGQTIALTALDTDTTSVDATGYFGILTATAGTATATTFNLKGDRAHNITGSSKNDTITMGSTTTAVPVIDGNGGTDVLNITLDGGATNFDSVTDVDTINIAVTTSAAITLNAQSTDADGLNAATAVNVTGGNALSTFSIDGTATLKDTTNTTLDFSGYNGTISDITWAVDDFDQSASGATMAVIGTANTGDTVSASYNAATDAALSLNMTGVETFDVDVLNHGTEYVFDMTKVTGLTLINFTDASAEKVEFKELASGVTVDATTDLHTAATTVEVKLATTSGTETQAFNINAENDNDDLDLVVADVETITIKAESAGQVDLDLSGLTMTTAGEVLSVSFTGANDVELTDLNADVTTVDASGMATGGSVIQTGRSATVKSTYTGSTGDDTFIAMNVSDVIAAGTGTDTLDVNFTAILGGINVNLTAANQIVSIDGSAPTGTFTGFENVDVSGFSGSFGARITALDATAGTFIGTSNPDILTGSSKADTFTISDGDTSTGLAGNDTYKITATDFDNISTKAVSINAGDGTGDILQFTDKSAGADADFAGFSNIEILDITTAASTVIPADNFFAAGLLTIDSTGATVDINLVDPSSTETTATAPLKITGYDLDEAKEVFHFGGGPAASNANLGADWTNTNGVLTATGATAATFFAAAKAATQTAGMVAAFKSGNDYYVFAEGAATGTTDDAYLHLVTPGTITSVSATKGAAVLHIE